MIFLLDTHLLLWASGAPERLSARARELINEPTSGLMFSTAAIWEVAIKSRLGRPDFHADARLLRRGLLENGYAELAVEGDHTVATLDLPEIHKDPFDRMLIAQATAEGARLVSDDRNVVRYGGVVLAV